MIKLRKRPAFYVPTNLSPKLFPREQRPYVAYFLNLVHWKWVCWQADDRGYVHLKSQYLRRIIPNEMWPAIADRLRAKQVIDLHDYYVRGVSSKGYRLRPEYQQTKRVVIKNERIARRIHDVYCKDNHLLPVHRWLDGRFNSLQFDLDRASAIIPSLMPELDSPMEPEEYHRLLQESAQRLANGDTGVDSVDRFGRVHTPITRLHRELRCCLHVDGEPLINIDLANSQPLMAGIVAAQFHRNKDAAHRLRQRAFLDGGKTYHKRLPPQVETSHRDLHDFIRLCERGELYESLDVDRNRAKKDFLTAMYAANSVKLPMANLIAERYPSLGSMLHDLKAKDHAHAACVMQNVEATIFVHGCCRRIMEERPEAPLFTLHDSLMTTPEHVEYVREVILCEFGKLNVSPTLRVES